MERVTSKVPLLDLSKTRQNQTRQPGPQPLPADLYLTQESSVETIVESEEINLPLCFKSFQRQKSKSKVTGSSRI